jgi:uncharacterized protein (TIGR00369 family)
MAPPDKDSQVLLKLVGQIHESLPFNQLLGMKVAYVKADGAGYVFSMRKELVGNFAKGILHGGVISAVLDATGGLTATASAVGRMQGLPMEEIAERVARFGTIDMRIDFLRPGRGEQFWASGTIMRSGRKVAVTRMELKNEEEMTIAVGTAAYIVG